MGNTYLAIDIEEKEGKMTLGYLIDGKLQLEEVHHFEYIQSEIDGASGKDIDTIINEIKTGLIKCKEINKLPVFVGVNEWNHEIIYKLCHLNTLSPLVIKPGSVIGSLAIEITEEVGYDCIVLISATKQMEANIEQILIGEDRENKISTISNLLFLMILSHEIPNLQTAQEYIK
jgi:hypothetical protein